MPLSWNEIRERAVAFSREWKGETSEDAEAKSFWDAFFQVFGITRRRIAAFELPVKKSDGKGGFIDLLWKGVLLVEHKSFGKDLDRAFHQATDYFAGLKDRDLPRYVLVSDFARFRLYDIDGNEPPFEFPIKDLHKNIRRFGFIAGYQTHSFGQQDPVNIRAAEKLGKLHDLLTAAGYDGHPLEVFLVRILFCLFAQNNSIFEMQQFREWIELRTSDDGLDLGQALHYLFQILDTSPGKRPKNLDEHLAAFRYINGKLFEEPIPVAPLDRKMREMILECTTLDWSRISPAIFGALFQSIMNPKARRNLGAHYTSETNILKALKPLFLDELRAEFERIRRDANRLGVFHDKLANIRVLDPACGCGNFLVIAYRELRLIELDVLRELFKSSKEGHLDVSSIVFVDVDRFYGIEVEEFPAQIAQVALWMTDHQMNQRVSEEFGQYFARLPLLKSPNIVYDNALALKWTDIVAPTQLTYIVGNPPFIGKKEQNKVQKAEVIATFKGVKGAGILDYVTCWYRKAAEYMALNTAIRAAFVSTNSITQGEQVGVLWPGLLQRGVTIGFAHRTFQWSSEAKGKATVQCVIIGFGLSEDPKKWLFEYETPKSEPHSVQATHINPYLVDAADIVLTNRRTPVCSVPELSFGSMPNDEGNLLLSAEQRSELLHSDPTTKPLVRKFLGSVEFLHGKSRYCLWLDGVSPAEVRKHPEIMKRVAAVKKVRTDSKRPTTKELASTPMLFGENRQPSVDYLAIPKTSGESRFYIPMAFLKAEVIASTELFTIPGAEPYHFGVLTSLMHMAWVRAVSGRLESRYRYSAGIVYNNFPWPEVTPKQRETITSAANAVLAARLLYPEATLADLYDPLTMHTPLVKAHQHLDRVVDAAYGRTSFLGEAERVSFLFAKYEKLTSLFSGLRQAKSRKPRKA